MIEVKPVNMGWCLDCVGLLLLFCLTDVGTRPTLTPGTLKVSSLSVHAGGITSDRMRRGTPPNPARLIGERTKVLRLLRIHNGSVGKAVNPQRGLRVFALNWQSTCKHADGHHGHATSGILR